MTLTTTTQTKLTQRQQDILSYLYLFRFLTRQQLQTLLGHKDKRRIHQWLHDLRQNGYIEGIYSRAQQDINKPAIYCASLGAIRYLKTRSDTQTNIITKLYRDYQRTPDFIQKCLTIADIVVQVQDASTSNDSYDYATQSDLADRASAAHFLTESKVSPDLVVVKTTYHATTRHLIQIITPTTPPYKVRSIIRGYHELQNTSHWRDYMHSTFPRVLFICATTLQLVQAKRYARFNTPGLPIDFILQDDLKSQSITTRLEP